MDQFIITGGKKINGAMKVSGAKNAILPVLAASILADEPVVIKEYPKLIDVENMLSILKILGCNIKLENDVLIIDPSTADKWEIPEELAREMRSSIVMLGSILGRFKKAKLTYPGGCEIGLRPIDQHLKSLRELGAEILESHGFIECNGENMKSCEINLDYPSVGATENTMLAAVKTKGRTIIRNAAKEPEIFDLQNFINGMGGKISGAGTNSIIIDGVEHLHSIEYKVIPDRIVAGTFMIAAAITGGDLWLEDIIPDHLQPIIFKLREAGCIISISQNKLHIIGPKIIKPVYNIETMPYPGFPTDMQAPFVSLLTVADGTSVVIENIFENRYKHTAELVRMGAKITVKDRMAVIKGVDMLTGAKVQAMDLRGGASLVIAGLKAEGCTTIDSIHYIDRGYEQLDTKLRELGAEIYRC